MSFRYLWRGAASVVMLVAVCALIWPRGFIHFLGIDTQQSDNYDFTSGPGPMLLTFLVSCTGAIGWWYHVNCHVDGCPSYGRYHVAGGQFRVCRKHHPLPAVRDRQLSHTHIALAHARHHAALRDIVPRDPAPRDPAPRGTADGTSPGPGPHA